MVVHGATGVKGRAASGGRGQWCQDRHDARVPLSSSFGLFPLTQLSRGTHGLGFLELALTVQESISRYSHFVGKINPLECVQRLPYGSKTDEKTNKEVHSVFVGHF